MEKTTSIMIVGVGGQGSLLASKLLGNLLTDEGYDVKVSEVHGMSQRGGSVVTYVRYGEKVYSPIVTAGECDYIISFEKLEAARYAACLKKGGKIIVNTQEIDPMPVITGMGSVCWVLTMILPPFRRQLAYRAASSFSKLMI